MVGPSTVEYTLLMSAASITIQPVMRATLSFDVLRDFSPVSLVVNGPFVLVVHLSVPARSANDLVALARSKPGALSYASSGVGSSPHFAGELFNALAEVKTAHVPYKGSPEAALGVARGEADFNFPSITGGRPLIQAGRVRPIAVSTAKRTALMPEMPTLHESGVPGYDRTGWYGNDPAGGGAKHQGRARRRHQARVVTAARHEETGVDATPKNSSTMR